MKPSPHEIIFQLPNIFVDDFEKFLFVFHATPSNIHTYTRIRRCCLSTLLLLEYYRLVLSVLRQKYHVLHHDVPAFDATIINTNHSMGQRPCEVISHPAQSVITFSDVYGTRTFIIVYISSSSWALS
jgi:hypothetical protein